MKKLLTLFSALVILLSLCACGSDKKPTSENTTLSDSDKTAVGMATDAVDYLKNQLVLPESFELVSVSYTSSAGEAVFKIIFSVKNNYGGVIDTAAYFTYNESEKVFADTYQSKIDLAEARQKLNTLKNGAAEGDDTSIYIEKSFFLDASESACKIYDIYSKTAKEIDISLIE